MDVLTDVLNTLELKGWLSSRRELASPWRYDFAASKDSMFHVLSFGGAYLQVEGEAEPIRVEDGDVLLFPTGHPHSLYDDPTSPLTRLVHLDYNPQRGIQVVDREGVGLKPLLLCGAFHFDYPNNFPLLHRLPQLIHIPGAQGHMEPGFADIMRLIIRESASQQPGGEVMLNRLTELLFIQVIRRWIEQQADTSMGWVGALRDQPVSAALGLIHQSPEHKWTVKELAEAVALSRSAFSARFTQLVGEPPLTYLTRWRMIRATRLLKNEVSVETIAELLGYESEAAFRKAFKREIGLPPAQYRRLG
ncbi:MAG: AraC family transcriptional regulator [Anaerolineae bacterium]|nr:AraC family transcriptional regulator [Anaerolineae bacterium]MCB9106429.1 AraC family transcriptional regulator [Anaerolineales bacterium]